MRAPCHDDIERPPLANGGDGFRVVVANKGGYPALEFSMRLETSHVIKTVCYEILCRTSGLGFFGTI
jgi:hypothetical protein